MEILEVVLFCRFNGIFTCGMKILLSLYNFVCLVKGVMWVLRLWRDVMTDTLASKKGCVINLRTQHKRLFLQGLHRWLVFFFFRKLDQDIPSRHEIDQVFKSKLGMYRIMMPQGFVDSGGGGHFLVNMFGKHLVHLRPVKTETNFGNCSPTRKNVRLEQPRATNDIFSHFLGF